MTMLPIQAHQENRHCTTELPVKLAVLTETSGATQVKVDLVSMSLCVNSSTCFFKAVHNPIIL